MVIASEGSLRDRIAVVLVEPRGPRNVGSTARAMKNFGLRDLRLVGGPPLDHPECLEMGVGSHDVLESARVYDTLPEAVADATFLVGSSARPRRRRETDEPANLAPTVLDEAQRGQCALLFGREDFGLFKEELRLCHRVVTIETHAERASLNLSQAVMVFAYELFRAAPESALRETREEGPFVDDATLHRLTAETSELATKTGYLHEGNRVAMEQSFVRLFRAGPIQTRDARHLFGLLRRIEKSWPPRNED